MVFSSTGTVEVQDSNTLTLEGASSLSGTVSLGNLAFLEFVNDPNRFGNTHTLNGLSESGPGWVRLVVSVPYENCLLRVDGPSTVANLDLNGGEIAGNGDGSVLTVSGTLSWTWGTMSGTGKTVAAELRMLDALGDFATARLRILSYRLLMPQGPVSWQTDSGLIGRGGDYSLPDEQFDNKGLRTQPAAGAFDAAAAAATLYRAMYGGLTSLGTDSDKIYKVLRGRSPAEVLAVRQSYGDHYGRDLINDLHDKLTTGQYQYVQPWLSSSLGPLPPPDEAARKVALNEAEAVARDIQYALDGGFGVEVLGGLVGTDSATVFRSLANKTPAQIADIRAAFARVFGVTLDARVTLRLSGLERERAQALLDSNQALADAIALEIAKPGSFGGRDSFLKEIDSTLSGKTPAEIAAIRQAYSDRFGRPLESLVTQSLDGAQLDQALGLLTSDALKTDAARLYAAMNGWLGLGTDEDAVWAVLDGKTSAYRAALAEVYQRTYGRELRATIRGDFSDSYFTGDELSKTLTLLYHGGLTDAQRLYYAMKGWGVDKATVRAVLANRTPEQIAQIVSDYAREFGGRLGPTLEAALRSKLSGSDLSDALRALRGRPETVEDAFQQLAEVYGETRPFGPDSGLLLSFFNGTGATLDTDFRRAAAYRAARIADGTYLFPEVQATMGRLIGYTQDDVSTYRDTKDRVAQVVGTAAGVALGLALVWVGGAAGAAPLMLVALGAVGGGAGEVLGRVTVAGRDYDVWRLPRDFIVGAANGAAGAVTFGRLPISGSLFARVADAAGLGAVQGFAAGAGGGIVGAVMEGGTWSGNLWGGLLRVGLAGLQGGVFGSLTGAALGGLLGVAVSTCFPAATPVATEAGRKPIEQVAAGERVWAYDFRGGRWALRTVQRLFQYDYRGDLATLQLPGERIEATGNHPFWVIEGEGLASRPKPEHVAAMEPGNAGTPGRWVDARDLRVGDVLLRRDAPPARVEGMAVRTAALPVYNLQVEGLHTYAVGEGEWLVHNRRSLMPTQGRKQGTWLSEQGVITRTNAAGQPDLRNGDNGVWRSQHPDVLAGEAARVGHPVTSVPVTYTNRFPDFSPYRWAVQEVVGDVRITLSRAKARTTRIDRDMDAADEAFANLLNAQGKTLDGRAYTRQDIAAFREPRRLTWHHHEDIGDGSNARMQLIDRDLNNNCAHTGGLQLWANQLAATNGWDPN